MRIKKFIHLLILLPLFIGTVVIGLLQTSFYNEKIMRDEIEIAQAITTESFNLLRLGRDIAQHPNEERASRQWRESFFKLNALIEQIDKIKYSKRLELMRHEKKMLEEIFTVLLELTNSGKESSAAQQFRFNSLENDMMVHSHTLSNEALQLMSQVRNDLAQQRAFLNQAVIVFISLFMFALTIILKRWGTRVLTRIEQLRQVTEIISTGNFKHFINNVDDDELGDFARAMNLMSQKLKQIEERVLERTNQLKAVNEQLNEMLFALDFSGIGIEIVDVETGRFEYVNACTCEMLDYSESEMLSMTVSDINPPFNSHRLQQLAEQMSQTTGKARFESVHYGRGGKSFPVDVTIYYQAAKENKAPRFIAFVSDITERKVFEEDLLKTKIAAENANHAKSVFLANMSHELRTPLNAILGFAQLLSRNNSVPETARNDVQTIIRCGQQLLSLINDVLEISSIETGHLKTRFDVINLPNLLSNLAETVQIANRNVWFHFEPSLNLPEFIETDFSKLRRILQNLLNNAVKFTHQGSITLQVYTHLEDEQEMLCIAVTDTGVGIEEKDKEFLFRPFFQSQHGMNLGVGTGLGLYISQEYAKLLGGQITVDSQVNAGSTFLVTLPLIRAKKVEKIVQHKGNVLGLAAGQTTKRVLVVDDQPENQHLISELLKQVGFQVSIAANGMQAVQSFQKWKPHFIYMDMRMPEMNGMEATKIIRAMSGGSHVPIVALTASLIEESHAEILEAGCNAVLRKPVEPNVLFETIATYLNLEFEYDNHAHQPILEKEVAFLDLSVLPSEIRLQLYNAAIGLDTELIGVIISELETDYPEIALYLKQLVEEFQFDFISSLTAPTKS